VRSIDACDDCLRRTWLVGALSPFIDAMRERYGRPDELMSLGDRELIDGLAGRHGDVIRAAYDAFDAAGPRSLIAAARLAAVCRHGDGYPRALEDTPAPPAVLHGAGPLAAGSLFAGLDTWAGERPAVAIVGARRCSEYGREVARSLGRGLGAAGVPVVSGMALGVDSAVHEGALDAGGPTVAVLGCGADVSYPASKRHLHARLMEAGGVVSELPPGFAPRRWCFPVRNRIIAGLASLTVVVEGGERSGSLITARLARDMGRDVGAVPGRITQPAAAGPNALLYDGAYVVRGAQDVLDVLFGAGARTAPPPRDPSVLTPALRRLRDAVASGRTTPAALTAAGFALDEALAGLAELEVCGYLRRGPGGEYVVVP
jgi:DNA processing protein